MVLGIDAKMSRRLAVHSCSRDLCTRLPFFLEPAVACKLRSGLSRPSIFPTLKSLNLWPPIPQPSPRALLVLLLPQRLLVLLSSSVSLSKSLFSVVTSSSAGLRRPSSSNRKTRQRQRKECKPIMNHAGRRAAFQFRAVKIVSQCLRDEDVSMHQAEATWVEQRTYRSQPKKEFCVPWQRRGTRQTCANG